jgi:cytidine deaminase
VGTTSKIINIKFEEYNSADDLSAEEKLLYEKAKQVRDNAYAPYSNFLVGAAVLLENNEVVTGSNQENAAYPSGLCAERVAVFYAGARFPGVAIKTIVLSCNSRHQRVTKPLSPCGSCRQVLAEYETRQGKKIRIVMGGDTGPLLACEGIENLLPLMFKGEFLK